MNRSAVVFFLAVSTAGLAAQQPQQQSAQQPPAPLVRTSSIIGQVVDADSGQPIGGAIVRLQSRLLAASAAPPPGGRAAAPLITLPGLPAPALPGTEVVLSDSDGRFMFHDLPKGATTVSATAAGYLDRPSSGVPQRPLQLEDAQHLSGVVIRLVKGASVSGVILDESGEPVVGASVRAMRRESPQGVPRYAFVTGSAGMNQPTDDRGAYRIDGLPPGQVFIVVPQMQTTVPASELDRPNLMMSAMNPMIEALTGGTQTSILPASVRIGDQAWRPAMGGQGVVAPPPPLNGRLAAYPTMFYPGASQLSQAAAITLRSGEDRTGVDLQIRPTASTRVSGVLAGASGPSPSVMIRLVPAPGRGEDDALAVASATTAADGSFTFLGVPAGQYVAKALMMPGGGPNLPAEVMANFPPEVLAQLQARNGMSDAFFLQTPVSVGDRDLTGLALTFRAGAKVSGKLVFDGAAAPPSAQQLQNAQVSLVPIGGGTSQTRLSADGAFKTGGMAPGTYTVNVVGIAGAWMLRSVVAGGREVLSTGLEVGDEDMSAVTLTFSDRPATVNGTVRQDAGGPLPNCSVVLVAAGYQATLTAGVGPRQSVAPVQSAGSYTVGRLVPGDYYVVALLDDAVPIDRDAAFFEMVARFGTKVTVSEGETKTVDLKIVRSVR